MTTAACWLLVPWLRRQAAMVAPPDRAVTPAAAAIFAAEEP